MSPTKTCRDRAERQLLESILSEGAALKGANRVLADNPDIKLLLEICPLALKQAGANTNDFIAALRDKGMVIRQVSSKGLIPLLPDWKSESSDWYVNLFTS